VRSLWFELTLHTDVVLSRDASTEGGHASLDFIPGACFLGICAGRLYGDLGPRAFDVFHGSTVRFLHAYPLSDRGTPSLPVPFAWHAPKGERWHMDDAIRSTVLVNLAADDLPTFEYWRENGIEAVQIREGYFDPFGSYLCPAARYDLKTAIDRKKGGRAREEHLFGYDSLEAGSRWCFRVDLDDDVPQETDTSITAVLTGGTIRIGKSRTAQYGRAAVVPMRYAPPASDPVPGAGAVRLYCLSDLALRDPLTGAPTLVPSADFFFEPEDQAVFLPGRSFVRTRGFAPFNAKRWCRDLERQVIEKGSVLTFSCERPQTPEWLQALRNRLAPGAGMYLHDGLGQVMVNPWFLAEERFQPQVLEPQSENEGIRAAPAKSRESVPPHELCTWLLQRHDRAETERRAERMVEKEWLPELAAAMRRAGRKGPRSSQWSQLKAAALRARNFGELDDALFSEKGLCCHGVSARCWKEKEVFLQQAGPRERVTFTDFLRAAMEKHRRTDAFLLFRSALILLGNRMPRKMNEVMK
jgi:CRISPR-associated protein Csx10